MLWAYGFFIAGVFLLRKPMKFLLTFICWTSLLSAQDVLTYHNDNARTGQNLSETILNLANVNSSSFGLLFTVPADGKVDAQPLYASNVAIPGQGTHNVLIVASENDSLYAYDADNGANLWTISVLGSGETPSDDRSCGQVIPIIGITEAPVISRTNGPNGAIYLTAMSKDAAGNYHHRLHAIGLATGSELFGGPVEIQATYPSSGPTSSNGYVSFDAKQYKNRVGLLLMNGIVYMAWASHCDIPPYTGWVMAYDSSTLQQVSVLNVTPNGSEGAIWMSQAGLAADSDGNIYLLDGNGSFDATLDSNGFPVNQDFGNSFLKISTSGALSVADYFEMDNEQKENSTDTDLGSGGAIVLPDMTDANGFVQHLAVGAGKDTNIYLVNRDSMGKFSSANNNIYQELPDALPGGIWGMPAYFNGYLYFGPVSGPIYAFQFQNAMLSTAPVAQTANAFPGVTPGVSANGSTDGIVWAAENTNPGVLHAYNATNLQELYNSNQASGGRDRFGSGNKFITPVVASGKVYVAFTTGVAVFGLLNSGPPGPGFDPQPGTYPAGLSVAVRSTTNGARIHFTTDGTEPTRSSNLYVHPLKITKSTTIKAISINNGVASPLSVGTYVVQ